MSSAVHAASPKTTTPSVLRRDAKKVEYNATLLNRLGGEDNLELTILHMYDTIMKDPMLQPFFANTDMAMLRAHQKRFMVLAFTEIPKDFDVAAFMVKRHYRLFEMGLNETHFDQVTGHLVEALKQMWVEPEVIDDVVRFLGPFRSVFEKTGRSDALMEFEEARRKKREERKIEMENGSSRSKSTTTATINKKEPKKKGVGRILLGEGLLSKLRIKGCMRYSKRRVPASH
jgi:hemoglobin